MLAKNANTKGCDNGQITQPYTADNPTVSWDKAYLNKLKGLVGPNLALADNPLPDPYMGRKVPGREREIREIE